MGFFTNNNYITHGFYAGYKWTKPKSFYNNIYLNLNGNYSQLNKPRKYQDFRVNGNVNGQLKNLWQFSMNMDLRPASFAYFTNAQDSVITGLRKRNTAENILNLFNIDMNYTWQIAPGSFVNINWKTSYDVSDRLVAEDYFQNFKKTLDTPPFNSLSVKLIYYLDYLDLKRKGNKSKK